MTRKNYTKMKNGLVIADAGPIISLALIDKLDILDKIFDEVKTDNSVGEEVSKDENKQFVDRIKEYLREKTCQIKVLTNLHLLWIMENQNYEYFR